MKTILIVLLTSLCCRGQIITTIAGTGAFGFAGDGGLATNAKFNTPNNLSFDKYDNLYVCDANNWRIRKINTAGIITTVAGNGVNDYGGDGQPATSAQLYTPVSVAVDLSNNIFISTNADNRIRKVNPSGIISTIAGNGINGYNGDGLNATSTQLNAPYLGAIDNVGNVIFSDALNRRVREINTTDIITTIAGNGMIDCIGDGGSALAASFKDPAWLCLDKDGIVYISDNSCKCVRKIDKTGIITTIAGTGIAGYSGDNGPATNAMLTYPDGITTDKSGNLYIADFGAHVVRMVNNAGIITTVAGSNIAGFSGDNGLATNAKLNGPNSVAVNSAGNLFIADYNNNRIRKVTYHPEGINDVNIVAQNISIYPNPARDEVIIETSPQPSPKEREVLLYNAIGQQVYKQPMNKDKTTIDISAYAPGLYFVHVGGVYAGRFVKE